MNSQGASESRFAARLLIFLVVVLVVGSYAIRSPAAADDGKKVSEQAQSSRKVWTCSMHPQVIQDGPGVCPICHMNLTPVTIKEGTKKKDETSSVHGTEQTAQANPNSSSRKIKYWWDPMLNPPYISDKPGKSPMGMDLIPVYEDEQADTANEIIIDPAVVQNMGLRVSVVETGTLRRAIKLFGVLQEAEPNIRDINLRVSGWVKKLYASSEGQHLKAGEPLFDLYSPDVRTVFGELIAARHLVPAGAKLDAASSGGMSGSLYESTVQKLLLLGIDRPQIERIAKLTAAPDTVTFYSPVNGHLIEKNVVEGASVKSGERTMRIVDHSTLWLDSQVFEKDISSISVGSKGTIEFESLPGQSLQAQVTFIHPHVDMMTRSGMARLEVPNPSLNLKPGMYASVTLEAVVSEHTLFVPREAVIDTGDSQVAFVMHEIGHFEPRKVQMGRSGNDGKVEIQNGLSAGESVVVSGQFLLDSESRVQEAIRKFLSLKAPA